MEMKHLEGLTSGKGGSSFSTRSLRVCVLSLLCPPQGWLWSKAGSISRTGLEAVPWGHIGQEGKLREGWGMDGKGTLAQQTCMVLRYSMW